MFTRLLHFDWIFFRRKKSFFLLLAAFPLLGLATATMANFPFPETYKNSPYVITYVTGVMSLMCIFSVTILAAQSLLREKDSHFDQVIYAAPLKKLPYLGSRFAIIFLLGVMTFALFMLGLLIGHEFFRTHPESFTDLHLWNYIQPFLLIAVPNILFCTAVTCSIGVLSKNRMVIYISGLFIYFLYWAVSLMANSPLMANASPLPPGQIQLMAKIDPFGLAAFFEQTHSWNAEQRNSVLPSWQGNLLFNRVLYILISAALLLFAYSRFRFSAGGKQKSIRFVKRKDAAPGLAYAPVSTVTNGMGYSFLVWRSHIKLDWRAVVKTIPLWLIVTGWVFFLGMELAGELGGSSRIPPPVATTALLFSNILEMLPVVGLLVMLFFGSEIYWRSEAVRFAPLEDSNPVPEFAPVLARCCSLSLVGLFMIGASIFIGIAFQLAYGHAEIDWQLYASLFYLVGLPFILYAVLIIAVHACSPNRYTGLLVSSVLLLLTNTSLGELFGLNRPLFRYANVYSGPYSEFNGFDIFLTAFHIRMLYWCCVAVAVLFLSSRLWQGNRKRKPGLSWIAGVCLSLAGAGSAGYVIATKTTTPGRNQRNDWMQAYENKYKRFSDLPQPVITRVTTAIDLFPADNSYRVTGRYTVVNKSTEAIDSLLLYTDRALQWQPIAIPGTRLLEQDSLYGHRWYRLDKSLQPGDSLSLPFAFTYRASAFNGFGAANAILRNGAFMRISNFYPRLGYMADNEIDDPGVRRRRGLPPSSVLMPLERKDTSRYEYGFIELDAVISTEKDQTALGIGQLQQSWTKDDRSYFHYVTPSPVPFRFAVASARYAVEKEQYRNINLEVYYEPQHGQNVDRLLHDAKNALDYCEQHFGPYPYHDLRLAEISSFTKGFAGTAYPSVLFINESFGFRNKMNADPGRDILNEMVSHELSHTWWGNASIDAEYREGSKLLTETLAMYTELMLYKKAYGMEPLTGRVAVHRDIYAGERTFTNEEPLYLSDPRKPFLCYDKGMWVMYQLYMLMGEDKINTALKNLLKKQAYPSGPSVATDLLNELYNVSDTALHGKIDELFKQVVTCDVQFSRATCIPRGSSYELEVEIKGNKYKEDGKGKKEPVAFTDSIEMEVQFAGSPARVVKTSTGNNHFVFPKKPVKLVLDPRLLLPELNVENNEKRLE